MGDAQAHQPIFFFGDFHLDPVNARLQRGSQTIPLKPRAFGVLHYLVQHPQRLVTKEEMLSAIWTKVFVCDSALRVCIREIRRVLCDASKTPRFIETVHRRGYRFMGEVSLRSGWAIPPQVQSSERQPVFRHRGPAFYGPPPRDIWLPGREDELAQLSARLECALQGERQFVFVTGELGIGKSALLEAFMARACVRPIRIAQCQCFEHHSQGHLPVVDALRQLLQQAGGEDARATLRILAPSSLMKMSSLIVQEEKGPANEMVGERSREHMLLEFVEAMHVLSKEIPIVLIIEDLHWSDYFTLDLITRLAGRRDAARLIVIASYRPDEVLQRDHPLKRLKLELQIRGRCVELKLAGLTEEGVSDYLEKQFPGHELPRDLGKWFHQHTDGNPLFLANTVEYLSATGLLTSLQGKLSLKIGKAELESFVPHGILQLIEDKFERLSAGERTLLESASVIGLEFSARTLATVLGEDVVEIEARCEKLVRSDQFLRASGRPYYPERRLASRYAFVHGLYRNALYQRMPIARRARLRQRIPQYLWMPDEAADVLKHFGEGLRASTAPIIYTPPCSDNPTSARTRKSGPIK
ncbi:MAG: AAA family ATPase [Gammaproteobacteria bacterium]